MEDFLRRFATVLVFVVLVPIGFFVMALMAYGLFGLAFYIAPWLGITVAVIEVVLGFMLMGYLLNLHERIDRK